MNISEIWNKIKYKDDENINEQFVGYDEDLDEAKVEKRRNILRSVLNGNWLTRDFVFRQRFLLLLIAVLAIIYIDNRYRSEQERALIVKLQKDVVEKRYEDLDVSAHLVEMSRQSHVIERLQRYNSKLKESNTPAVKIDD